MREISRFIIQFTWMIPQTLLGLIMLIILKLSKRIVGEGSWHKEQRLYYYDGGKLITGVSLGRYVFLDYRYDTKIKPEYRDRVLMHEFGHYMQSLILGPAYLIIIGLPSITWNTFTYLAKLQKYYYKFYTEAWADLHAGIDRSVEIKPY